MSQNAAEATIEKPVDTGAIVVADVRLTPDTAIDVHTIRNIDESYRRSVVQIGRPWGNGVILLAQREDLVRLLVKLSEHLDGLDRDDAADRKVGEGGES